MSEQYTEQPPEGSFEELDDIHTMDDLNKLAQLYEFQINSMATNQDGMVIPKDSQLEEQVRTSIKYLDHFAEKLGCKDQQIEITGSGWVPADPDSPMGSAGVLYDTFKGLYLGFAAREEYDSETGMLRYELGHLIYKDTIRITGFLRDLTEVIRTFVPVLNTERIETPENRLAREIEYLAAKLEKDDEIALAIDRVLFDCEYGVDMQRLGGIVDSVEFRQLPLKKQDLYLDYLNLKTALDGKPMSVVSSCALLPSPGTPELLNAEGTIIGVARGLCLLGTIDLEADGGAEINDIPSLYLALEVIDDGRQFVALVPTQRISVYETHDE